MFDNGMKVTGFGGLTRNGELKVNAKGIAFLKFSLGVSKSKKVNEEWIQEKHYFNCTVIGKYAETLAPYMLQGTQVFISGNLEFNSWEQDGQKRSNISIKVDDLEIIKKAESNSQQNNNQSNNSYSQNNNQGSYKQQSKNVQGGQFEDDIPF